jgi:hypothetical protein
MSYILRHDAGNIKTIAASDNHTNRSLYVGTGSQNIDTLIDLYPKTSAKKFHDILLLASLFLPRLDDDTIGDNRDRDCPHPRRNRAVKKYENLEASAIKRFFPFPKKTGVTWNLA